MNLVVMPEMKQTTIDLDNLSHGEMFVEQGDRDTVWLVTDDNDNVIIVAAKDPIHVGHVNKRAGMDALVIPVMVIEPAKLRYMIDEDF